MPHLVMDFRKRDKIEIYHDLEELRMSEISELLCFGGYKYSDNKIPMILSGTKGSIQIIRETFSAYF